MHGLNQRVVLIAGHEHDITRLPRDHQLDTILYDLIESTSEIGSGLTNGHRSHDDDANTAYSITYRYSRARG